MTTWDKDEAYYEGLSEDDKQQLQHCLSCGRMMPSPEQAFVAIVLGFGLLIAILSLVTGTVEGNGDRAGVDEAAHVAAGHRLAGGGL